jgi:hypothetical protein
VPDQRDPSSIPLYDGQAAIEEAYSEAEGSGTPFFAVEEYEEGFAVTYDLLPAGASLSLTAQKEVEARLTQEIESIVADDSLPTVEVGKTVNDSLGNISMFEREDSARRVASVIAPLVLDEANWTG